MKNVAARDGALPAGYLRSGDAAKKSRRLRTRWVIVGISKTIASSRQDCSCGLAAKKTLTYATHESIFLT